MVLALVVAVTVIVSLASTGLARAYASRRGMLDQPGPRRSHREPTPRGGGFGIVLGLGCGLGGAATFGLLEWPLTGVMLAGLLTIAALGLADDHRPINSFLRLGLQFLIAVVTLWALGGLQQLQFGPWGVENGWLRQLLAVVALVWLTNLFNFMDGIDGLAAWQTVFSAGFIATLAAGGGASELAYIALLIAAAGIGFLPWNWPRARIFMGDVGSSGLGFFFGLICVLGANSGTLSVLLSAMVFGLFVTDATATFLLRLLRGHRWYNAHREHAYQLWTRMGWSHVRVVAVAMLLNLVFILPLVWWARTEPWREIFAAAVLFGGLLALWTWTRIVNRSVEVASQ